MSDRTAPGLPFTPIVIDGATYKMCFDFAALADAEEALNATLPDDRQISLLAASWKLSIKNVQTIFAASLVIYHPEIAFEDARALVTWANSADIVIALKQAQKAFLPEPAKEGDGGSGDPTAAAS